MYLNVSSNLLQGTIPEAIFVSLMLKEIDVSQNGFTGVIPSRLGDLTNLHIIRFNANQFEGSIPKNIFRALQIEELMIQSNQLTGSIPTEVGNLKNATILAMNHNSLKDVIPSELQNLQNLKLLHLQHNQLTGRAPEVLFHNITKDNYITDCGYSSFSLGDAIQCETCTMCCNSEEVCREKIQRKLSTPLLSVLFSLAFPTGVTVIIFILIKMISKSGLWRSIKERDILKDYCRDSVYCFIFSDHLGADFIYVITAAIQICLFAAYLDASSKDSLFSSDAYPFVCSDNNLKCEQIHSNAVGDFGWVLFFMVTILYLAKDLGMSLIQIGKGTTLLDFRLIISGLILLSLTVLAAFTSYVYNVASVETNADFITNAVILFFIHDIDEKVMSALNILVPDWTEDRIDEIKRKLMIKSGTYKPDITSTAADDKSGQRHSTPTRALST